MTATQTPPRRAAVEVDRLPPHSLDAEQGILGCIILDPNEAMPVCIDRIRKSEVWFDLRHRTIYEVLLELYDARTPIDSITLRQKLKDTGQLDAVGGIVFISTLPDMTPSAANVGHYLDILLEKYRLRRVSQFCTEVVSDVYNSPESAKVFAKLEKGLLEITSETPVRQVTIKEAVHGALNTMEEAHKRGENGGSTLTGLSWGFVDLNRMTGGLKNSDMIVIAARPSVGKSSLAMNIAESVAVDQRCPVGVFSLEMDTASLVQRMLCSRARVNSRHIRDGFLTQSDFTKIAGAAGKLANAPMFIDDSAGLTLTQFRSRARRMHQLHDIKLFVVDYLQLLSLGGRVENRQREVGTISNGIKQLAKELNVPVIVLSQLSRDLENGGKGKPRRPRLSDLRESGEIEQDADIVGLMSREDGQNQSPDDEAAPVLLDIAKHRNGATGEVHLTFLKNFTRFESAAKITAED